MFYSKSASATPLEALLRYLILCTVCHKKDGKAIDPDGEVLE